MIHTPPKTYLHSVTAEGMEVHVHLLVADLMDAAAAIQAEARCSRDASNAMSKILHEDMAGMNQSQFSQGMDLLELAIGLLESATRLGVSPAVRSKALSLLHDPSAVQSMLERMQDRISSIKSRNGILDDSDVNAITFLILDRAEKPGVFRKSLKEVFAASPPDYTQTHVLFTDILIKKASYYVAARAEAAALLNHDNSSGTSFPSLP